MPNGHTTRLFRTTGAAGAASLAAFTDQAHARAAAAASTTLGRTALDVAADESNFHEGIGSERKAARLRYLRDRWATRLKQSDRVRLQTNLDPAHSCAIGTVQITGVPTAKVVAQLWDRWRIIATPIVNAEYEGLRVTPNVYTTLEEVDTFATAMEDIVKNGIA